jgi:uncharacterized protein
VNSLIKEFIHLFNEEKDFYECHELFEEAWKAAVDPQEAVFYKALVQVATAQFKLNKGLFQGIRKLYGFCEEPLRSLPDDFMGLDLARLQLDFREQLDSLPTDLDTIGEGEFPLYGLSYLILRQTESESG